MNPINVNSSNITSFGFSSIFKLFDKKISFSIADITQFIGGGASGVLGVYFKIVDPTGIVVKDLDFTTPDIHPAASSVYDFNIPSIPFGFGWWTLIGVIRDADSTDYTVTVRVNICQPKDFDTKLNGISGKMSAGVNCYAPSIKVSEQTVFAYIEKAPVSIVKSGHLYYPQGTLAPLAFTFTPLAIIGSGNVYTGDYIVKNTSTAQYALNDYVFVELKYFTTLKFTASCMSLVASVICCVNDIRDTYRRSPQSERGIDAKYKLDRITIPLYSALIAEKSGQDASADVEEIKRILDCDCGCGSVLIEPYPLGTDGSPVIIQLQQAGGVTINSSTSGNTQNYVISSKVVQVTKDVDDLSFSITKSESQYGVVYTIAFDYVTLAETILNTIKTDEGLTALIKSIVATANGGIDLGGITSSCVISIANCNYILVEPTNVAKTIVSVTIDNVVHNAPSSLMLTNVSGISTWLNGLAKGTFAVTLDSGSGTVNIVSNTNSHLITAFILTAGSSTLTRQFSRSCIGLVDLLNAITTYICALNTTQIKFGVASKDICGFNGSGVVQTTPIDPTISLGDLLTNMLAAQCALFNKISSIALTCANVATLFVVSANPVTASDGVLGTKTDACAKILYPDLMSILLNAVAASPDLKAAFCSLVGTCNGPTCSAPTNVSGVLSSGPTCAAVTNINGSVS